MWWVFNFKSSHVIECHKSQVKSVIIIRINERVLVLRYRRTLLNELHTFFTNSLCYPLYSINISLQTLCSLYLTNANENFFTAFYPMNWWSHFTRTFMSISPYNRQTNTKKCQRIYLWFHVFMLHENWRVQN